MDRGRVAVVAYVNAVRRRWAALRSDTSLRVWLVIAAVGVGALVLYDTRLAGLSATFASPRLPWWGLALIFFLAESFPVHLHFRSETHSLSLSEVGIVLGLFLASPAALVLGLVAGAGCALVLVRRQRPLKLAFNVAQFGLSTCVALIAFRAVAALGDAHGPVGWAAAAAGAAAFGIVSVALVTTTISIAAGGPPLRELPRTISLALAGSLASASLAVVAVARLLEADTRAVWLLVVPALLWGLAFRAYGAQRRRHEHLEFLYQTMRATQGAPASARRFASCSSLHARCSRPSTRRSSCSARRPRKACCTAWSDVVPAADAAGDDDRWGRTRRSHGDRA